MTDKNPKNPPVIILADVGNTGAKTVILFEEKGVIKTIEFTLPHGYMPLTDMQWTQEEQAVKTGRAGSSFTHTFKYVAGTPKEPRYYPVKIGKGAVLSGASTTVYGNGKYVEGYIDAYLTAVFCELFPKKHFAEGYDNIYLAFGVPPSDWSMTPTLLNLLGKNHRIVDTDGSKRVFKIREIMAIDENQGGTVQAMAMLGKLKERQSGQYTSLKAKQRIIVVDSGGFLGSMAWGQISEEGMPVIEYSPERIFPISSGIVKVRAQLRQTLKHYHSAETQGLEEGQMDDIWLDDIIKSGQFFISGSKEGVKCKAAIDEATGTYLNAQKSTWALMGYGKQADHILMTGGTSDPLFDHLKKLYKHHSIILADKREEIYMANVRGFVHIFVDSLLTNKKLDDHFAKLFRSEKVQLA